VITQQLQADELAVEMSAQLFSLAPHREAKLYYTTMVQDESRHTEAWLQLVHEAGGQGERDPYLDKMATLVIGSDTLEEKVFLMQVFFERLIIPKFKMIAKATPGTVLQAMCQRLSIDDGIHHGAGVAYERVLLRQASKKTKGKLVKAANDLLPIFVEHELWRPRERAWIGDAMRSADIARLRSEIDHGVRLANSLGVDVGEVVLPF
jgi:1,2-phenylacetyl-CoA epoxidase catalytic subunit